MNKIGEFEVRRQGLFLKRTDYLFELLRLIGVPFYYNQLDDIKTCVLIKNFRSLKEKK